MFKRALEIKKSLKNRSLFIFGPRMVGKSYFLRTLLPDAMFVDLLEFKIFQLLAINPHALEDMLKKHLRSEAQTPLICVIDEIQKLPLLLNEVHRLIEKYANLRFVLTGSSARKLHRADINFLGGRAHRVYLHPLTSQEVASWPKHDLTWKDLLEHGGLPAYTVSKNYQQDLEAYCGLYLQEEIASEGLIRSLPNFIHFLQIAAQNNSQQIVFERIGQEAGLSAKIVKGYFEVLQDTLVGYLIPSFKETEKRKPMTIPKFYFFDLGMVNALQGQFLISHRSAHFGFVFEHFVFLELYAYKDYRNPQAEISYWRSTSKIEVDFVIKSKKTYIGIEVKTKENIVEDYAKPLQALSEEIPHLRKIIIGINCIPRLLKDNTEIFEINGFLNELWAGNIF